MNNNSLRKHTLLNTTNSRRFSHSLLSQMSYYDSNKRISVINKRKVKNPKKFNARQIYVSPLQRRSSLFMRCSSAEKESKGIIISDEDLEEAVNVRSQSVTDKQRFENAYSPVSKINEMETEEQSKPTESAISKLKSIATNSKKQLPKIRRRPLHDGQSSVSNEEAGSPNIESLYFRKVKSIRPDMESCCSTQGKSYKEDDCVQFVKEYKSSSYPSFPSRKTKNKESAKKLNASYNDLNAASLAGKTMQHDSSNFSSCDSSLNDDKRTVNKMECSTTTCNDSSSLQTAVSKLSKNPVIAHDSEEDDLIVIPNSDKDQEYVDYFTLKKSITSMLNHNAAENPTQEITLQYIVQRLRTLYHQDFTKRMTEVEHCLERAKLRFRLSHSKMQEIRPGVRQSDVDTLEPEEWLNDVIINEYMSILVHDSDDYDAISSFCHEELLRGKEPSLPIDWKRYSGILIPVCIESHWSLMKFKPSTMDISLYSSMALCKYEIQCAQMLQKFFRHKAGMQNCGKLFTLENLPRQENEYDCGVYVCMFARCIVYGNSFHILPAQVSAYRNWLKMEISSSQLHGAKDEDNNESVIESDTESGIECLE